MDLVIDIDTAQPNNNTTINMLLVNKQVHVELLPVLYKNATFNINLQCTEMKPDDLKFPSPLVCAPTISAFKVNLNLLGKWDESDGSKLINGPIGKTLVLARRCDIKLHKYLKTRLATAIDTRNLVVACLQQNKNNDRDWHCDYPRVGRISITYIEMGRGMVLEKILSQLRKQIMDGTIGAR